MSSTETDNGSTTISSEYRDPKIEARLSDVRERSLYRRRDARPTKLRDFEMALIDVNVAQSTLFHFMTAGHFLQNASIAQQSSSPVSIYHTAACVMQSLVCVARCDGKIKLWTVPEPPEPLATLLTDTSQRSRLFRRNIRRYHCALCMASMQANEVTFSQGPSVFKVHGEIHRFIGPMHHSKGQQPKCLQTFFVDATMQANIGVERFDDIGQIRISHRKWKGVR